MIIFRVVWVIIWIATLNQRALGFKLSSNIVIYLIISIFESTFWIIGTCFERTYHQYLYIFFKVLNLYLYWTIKSSALSGLPMTANICWGWNRGYGVNNLCSVKWKKTDTIKADLSVPITVKEYSCFVIQFLKMYRNRFKN